MLIMPLGNGVEVRIPGDLISTAESVFQKRDPYFEFGAEPVEIKIEGLRERPGESISHSRRPQNPLTDTFISCRNFFEIVGDYRVIVRRGPVKVIGGWRESVSICDKQTFTYAAGEFAAMLLDGPKALSMSQWPEDRIALKPMAPHR